jgi:glycosyltransferase involved in cell wall biosynthesis
VITLGNGIDLERFSPERPDPLEVAKFRSDLGVNDDQVLVGAVGRLVWGKGLKELFNAARLLRTRCPRVRVVVVGPVDHSKGDGLTEADLRRIEAQTGVVFVGERLDMDVVYAALDIYVLPSYREGFPRSAMEASAMGTPVLATNIRGCRQVVEHGRTGLLFPVRDTEALANALVRAAEDDGARERWGRAAVAKARAEFDQQRVIDVTLEVYERLLARHRS